MEDPLQDWDKIADSTIQLFVDHRILPAAVTTR